MPRFPYMGFPFPYYNNPQSFSAPNLPKSIDYTPSSYDTFKKSHCCDTKKQETCFNTEQKNKSNNNNDNYLFDLFGLKLYTDDVLLVSLIYFLYSEEVKDESLFIVLILLLLS